MTNPLDQVLDLVKQAKALSEPWKTPMTESQREMLKAKLDKLKEKKIRSKRKYEIDEEPQEPAYYEGSGNTPFGYSQDGDDNNN